jgi:ribosomal protein L22
MSDQPHTPEDDTPDEVALAADAAVSPPESDAPAIAEPRETPDAPAADVDRPETRRAEVIDATEAIDTLAPEPARGTGDAPDLDAASAAPASHEPTAADTPAPPARKRDAKAATPGRKPSTHSPQAAKGAGGKIARDKHGHPIVTGPVVQAHAKYVRTSARKARLVCDHIRGKSVDEAVAILAHTPRAVAEDWEKLLKSAVANAEHNHELLGDDLKVHAVFADEGPTLKRFRPRAMGRATQIRKRTSHLTIQLTPKEQ